MIKRRFIRRITPFWKRRAARKIVLPSKIQKQITEISENVSKQFDEYNRILLIGKPSQNTMSAKVIDFVLDYPLYRVDLASIVNKYIGETEKNLKKVLDYAERKDCILFFDEADALFGKRTDVSDAHGRYANLEVSWLLQRIEAYEGIVVLASNEKGRISVDVLEKLCIKVTLEIEEDEDEEK
jgi:SpoVK/Ycf46/Vps4 family AAA+-type ATPase